MGPSSWQSKSTKRLFFLLFLTILLAYFFVAYHRDPDRRSLSHALVFDRDASDWWAEYFTHLEAAQPSTTPLRIKTDTKTSFETWHPETPLARPDLLKLSGKVRTSLRDAHSSFVSGLADLATKLPFRPGTTGIVTSTGASNFGQVVTLLLMIRQSGSTLPVQVILELSSPSVNHLCSTALRPLGATCVFPQDAWIGAVRPVPGFQSSQWKALAIIASTFQNVLFLDPNSLPVQNPDPIFAANAQPFSSTGFITWADIWTPTGSPEFYTIVGDMEPPALTARASSESGILVIDKARHADTLLLAAYYNHYGPDYYYPLLAQHGLGDPGKETYLASALALSFLSRKGTYTAPDEWTRTTPKSTKKGHWDIKAPPRIYKNTAVASQAREMTVTAQIDPVEDYRAVLAALEEDSYRRKHLDTERADTEDAWLQVSGQEQQHHGDYRDRVTDSRFLDILGNLTLSPRKGKYMFFRHHGMKLDFGGATDGVLATDENGLHVRMWGEPGWIVANTGRDVEKILWEDAMGFWCGLSGYRKQCRVMKEVYEAVYARFYS